MPTRPHLEQSIFGSIWPDWRLFLSIVWTDESFWRSGEGKSEGFVRVTIVREGISITNV